MSTGCGSKSFATSQVRESVSSAGRTWGAVEALDSAIKDWDLGVHLVASHSRDGERRFVLYGRPDEVKADEIRAEVTRLAGEPRFRGLLPLECVVTSDPKADALFAEFWPTNDDLHSWFNMEQCKKFAQAGDDVNVERPICHRIGFRTKEDALAFKRLASPHIAVKDADLNIEGFPVGVITERTMALWPQHIWEDTVMLDRMARETGGAYDAWSAQVLSVPAPKPKRKWWFGR